MAKLIDILQQERERGTEAQWGVIHLYKTGMFYSAYEWSAWLISVITYNDKVRMATKDRSPLSVIRINMANSDETFCRVGFPLKSIEKYIPERIGFDSEDDKHITVTIALPQPKDGTAVTYERLLKAVEEWKKTQPIKEPKDKKDSNPQEDTDRQPAQGAAKAKPAKSTIGIQGGQGGLIMQIMSYQLSARTPMENYEFIQRLQQQIASIL